MASSYNQATRILFINCRRCCHERHDSVHLPAAALITSGKIRVDPQTEPAGSYFTFTIPSLKPFIQEDGTVTLMLSTMTGRHKVLVLSAREHESFAGPLLTFETQERDVK